MFCRGVRQRSERMRGGVNRVLAIIAVAVLCAGLPGCSKFFKKKAKPAKEAAETPVETKTPPKREIPTKVKELAKRRFEAALAKAKKFDRKAATRKLVLDKYNFDLDEIFEGDYDLEQIKSKKAMEALILTESRKITEKQYSKEARAKILAKAEKAHPYYQLGDIIEVTTRRKEVIKGELQAIHDDVILIRGKRILTADMEAPNPVVFNKGVIMRRRRKYIETNFDRYKEPFFRKAQARLKPKLYHEHGWVKLGKDWVSLNTLISAEIIPEVDRAEKKYDQKLKKKLQMRIIRHLKKEGLMPKDE